MEHSDTKATPQQGPMQYVLLAPAEIVSSFATHKNQARSGALFGFALASVLIITGCTGGNSLPNTSDGPPPSSSSPTAIATTESAPATSAVPIYKPATDQGPAENVPVPMLPEKAKEFSKEGLIAFTEYWYQTLGYAFETGDPAPMMAISDPSCKTCGAMKDSVIGGHADGKWIKGGKMVIDPPRSAFVKMADGTYQALTMARQEQVLFFNADGEVRKDTGVTIAERDILVATYADSQWTALTVEHVAGSKSS